ncbi:MAG: DUF4169 family protein [Pseudomonadota bacterium]
MAEVVNLRHARKRRARAADRAKADANAARHGRSKAERDADAAEAGREARRLDGHRLEDPGPDAGT